VKFSCRRKEKSTIKVKVEIASGPSYIFVAGVSNISLSMRIMFDNIIAYSTAIPVGLSAQVNYF
jgi:hypothetical protein